MNSIQTWMQHERDRQICQINQYGLDSQPERCTQTIDNVIKLYAKKYIFTYLHIE